MPLGRPRNHGCRISDEWTFQGLRTLILENELLRVVVLVDKGSDILEFRYKPLDLDFLLLTPGGVRNPARNPASIQTQSPFIDYYSGGWNDVLPNGGPPATYQGAEFGQHGEVSLLAWDYSLLEDSPQRVAVRLWVRALRTPFFVEKTLSLEPGQAALHIEETVTNEGGQPLHFMWGQHIAFGRDFLREGAVIDIPAEQFIVHEAMPGYEPRRFQPGAHSPWPNVPAPDGHPVDASLVPAEGELRAQEMAYMTGLREGWYAVTNPQRKVGFGLQFDPALFRYVWCWQQLGDVAAGYPWWQRTHTIALEPWTSYPTSGLPEAIRNGSARQLQPGEHIHTQFTAVAYQGLERVRRITPKGQVEGS
jgi:galactose mutarotase-like enzyme